MEKGWSLTVCLIVKNEEHCLGDCLASIKTWADQLVVVDTGSTDNSVQVARKYGAQIEYLQWENDFAKARNYSLQFAVCDWILVLDADERIVNGEILPDLVAKANEGYYVTIKSPLGAGVEAEDHVVRLFRNGRGYKFTGAIHEQIAGSIKAIKGEGAIGFSGIVVRHLGYEREEILRKQKTVRNSQIIKNQLAQRQNDAFMLYSLGTELIQQAQYQEAYIVLMKALRNMTGGEGYFREVVLLALMASLKNRDYSGSEDLFVKALAMMPADSDILFLAGLRQAAVGAFNLALEMFAKGGMNTVLVPPSLCCAIIAELFFRQKLWQEAIKYFKLSLKYDPTLYGVVRMIEIVRQGEVKAVHELAESLSENFLKLAQEAVESGDNCAAAVIYLATINKNNGQLFDQWKSSYQAIITKADSPAVIKNYLDILYRQMELCNAVLAADQECRVAQYYLAKAVNRSLEVWLTIWPEHIMPINIWECCL